MLAESNRSRDNHERSRREMAVAIMQCFVEGQNPADCQVTYAVELINDLGSEKAKAMWRGEIFEVEDKHLPLLELYRAAHYAKLSPKISKGYDTAKPKLLTLGEVLALKRVAISVLNRLELIASAYRHSIADKQILEEEFSAVFCPKPGEFVLQACREASGIYPSIKEICRRYSELRMPASPKSPTGEEKESEGSPKRKRLFGFLRGADQRA